MSRLKAYEVKANQDTPSGWYYEVDDVMEVLRPLESYKKAVIANKSWEAFIKLDNGAKAIDETLKGFGVELEV